MALMQALRQRQSRRQLEARALPPQTLSDLLWAAAGINRKESGGRTAPSALNSHEIDLYVAQRDGLYLYRPNPHELELRVQGDIRRSSGYQDFDDDSALELIFVADLTRMKLVPAARRETYAAAAAGAIAQNVYLFCASAELGAAIRAWIDPGILAALMQLGAGQQIVLSQAVGFVKGAERTPVSSSRRTLVPCPTRGPGSTG